MIWPEGSGARREGSTVLLLDRDGETVARTGDTVRPDGGFPDQAGSFWVRGAVQVLERAGG